MSLYNDFLSRKKNTAKDNESYYRKYAQEWINKYFYDTTLVRDIKEEIYPFSNNYKDYEVHIDSVSDVTINTNKAIGSYLSLIFKDCEHKTYRGQKYIYNDEPYLCYDTTKPLSRIAKTQIIKCNNKLRWIDDNGAIIQEPCFIGWEVSATNSNITKDSTIEQRRLICLIQGNENTDKIKTNQRFLLSKDNALKVTQIFKENLDNINDSYSNMFTLYIEWSTVSSKDNKELLLADYYITNYKVEINQTNLELLNGDIGTLSATTYLNDKIEPLNVVWVSSNPNVIKVSTSGEYEVIGNIGDTCTVQVKLQDNEQISDSIDITIVENQSVEKVLKLNPSEINSIKMNTSNTINYGVYINETLQSDMINISYSGANSNCYTITDTNNMLTIKCLKSSSIPLTITFVSGALTKAITIKLVGLL